MQNLPTDNIATALLTTLDALTAQFADRIRADFAAVLAKYRIEDGMGFNKTNRYSTRASHAMRFSASYRYGTGENSGCIVYSAEIDNAKVDETAREEAVATLLMWHKKLVGKLGAVESCEIKWNNNGNIDMAVTKAGRGIELRQQVVFKYSPRGRWFCQFPARIYVGGKFTPETQFKAMFAA